ncbi:secondary thiamine-phosphate synthase [Hydrogenovibrio crunogenus]|uniref:Secondary thiamine-phosphate synthase n=1 Tax=Hydrogenovibrio crunogenus TaxID=39765 RepID=A0A4P7NX56_9GAMM|nr:secondary thiamine-phosphate synthase enzyme YjbQ [Hydrogenovibrio crunogenus]QBZ82035.1 secondary thiamine-phosphate synthase [Hydrogenovibrio crunogenus]RUM91908.1 MAG: YjbQ family protein [Thiomicrospira sp.]
MKIYQSTLTFHTSNRGTFNITDDIDEVIAESEISVGLCHVFCQHTSASLIITENADPTVRQDIEYWMQKHIIDGDRNYRHNYEGDDDMSGHIRTLLTETSHTLPISNGELNMGTWQGLFLYEHRTGRFNRQVIVTIQGE